MKPDWSKRALRDLDGIDRYVRTRNPAAARKLLELILDSGNGLPAMPGKGRIGRKSGTRELVVHKSYIIIYRAAGPRITILRVLHIARRWP